MTVLPNVPTIAEEGYPGYEWHNWFGYLAPAGTPESVIAKLNKELVSFLAIPKIRQEYLDAGYEIAAGSPNDLAALIRKDTQRYGDQIREIGITAD